MTMINLKTMLVAAGLAVALPAMALAQSSGGAGGSASGGAGGVSGGAAGSAGGSLGAGGSSGTMGSGSGTMNRNGANDPATTGTVGQGEDRCAGVLANRSRYPADVVSGCEKK
ncbi:hypothetical protein [Alsobacter sp. R-9]